MQRAVIGAGLVALGAAILAAAGTSARVPIRALVPCDHIIFDLAAATAGRRIVLEHVALPPEDFSSRPHYARHRRPFPYFAKSGIEVRYVDAVVELAVPAAWRNRLAIGWGSPARPASSVRIPPCAASGEASAAWRAYAGGYWLRRPACVPLIVRVGSETTRIRLGIGVDCPPQGSAHARAEAK